MTRPAAIDQEREHLAAMIELLALEIEGEPIKRERPDFIVSLRDGRTVGIELVRAVDERIAGGRGARRRLKTQLRDALTAAGLNARVNVSISDETAARLNADTPSLRSEIQAVVALVRATLDEGTGRSCVYEPLDEDEEDDESPDGDQSAGRRELSGTRIQHLDAIGIYPGTEARVTWSGLSNGQHSNIVQEAIDGKADDLSIYRQCGADEIWLLIIGSTGTGGALFIDDVEDVAFRSAYDKTVFLELFERRCMILDTTTG